MSTPEAIIHIVADVRANWTLYVSMPLVAATIGYATKIAAIYMMFQPVNFVGVPPYLGWQGIIPRNARRMASIACDTLTAKLLKPEDMLSRLDPLHIAAAINQPLRDSVQQIVHEVFEQHAPGLWTLAPTRLRQRLIRRIQDKAPLLVEEILVKVRADIGAVFDLKDMVVTNLSRDKPLLNQMFQEVGREEFRFIRNSGIYFGLLIGCVQAVAWALTHSMWIMPLFGGLTGWLSDWLALRMVFRPKEPTRYFGLFTWHGLFIKRRHQVAAEYCRLMTEKVLTPSAILDSILRGPLSDRLYEVVQSEVRAAVDEEAGFARPFVVMAVGSAKYLEMKRMVAAKVTEALPETLKHVEPYAFEAMDLENTLRSKMKALTVDEFEGLLRPAFQQDERTLIAVGAALGFLVGELQVHVMLAFAVTPT